MKLYEIAADYAALMDAIEAGDIPEEAIADTLESVEAVLEDKVDNIACLIKNALAEAAAIKVEEDKLAERRKAKTRQADRLEEYLSRTLLQHGCLKIESARNKISFRKSESVSIADEAAFIEWAQKNDDSLLTYKDPTANRTAIKKAIGDGREIPGACIVKNQNIQIK